jgi:hypothetical protein
MSLSKQIPASFSSDSGLQNVSMKSDEEIRSHFTKSEETNGIVPVVLQNT